MLNSAIDEIFSDVFSAESSPVICDDCGKDYTESDKCGGLLFQSKAICPSCAPKWKASAEQYNETHFIRDTCPPRMRFSVWVRRLRGEAS